MKKINAIILHEDSLISLGLSKILRELFNIEVNIEHNLSDAMNLDDYDLIFVSPNTFALCHTKFITLKFKIIFISNFNSNHPQENTENFISSQWTEEAIINYIGKKISSLTEIKSSKNELSKREIDVLKLIVSGYLNKQIADELNISINTVLTHRKNLTAKLGIKSVSGLSVYAMMNGLI
ncbi:MAG: hypothetical protein E7080_02235 [Bacteroidales bacterium]|nr:hypothetical protein [Bacteroidales bacterium]